MTPNSTTKLGITVFDQAFGGIYLHRPTILCGRRKSGKFVVATQFLVKTLRAGEKVVLFTAKNPEEVIRTVPDDIIDLSETVENGQFLICPYSSMQRSGSGPYAPLPFPQALDELAALVKDNGVSYAIFDSIVPWTAIHPLEAMQENADTFFATLDSLSLTSLLLLPEPASAAALSLATVLREVCPINIEISAKNFGAEFTMQVTKYQGLASAARKLPQKFSLDLTPGVGFDSPDAPKAKTLSDLEAFASTNRAAAEHKQKAGPVFRPFLSSGLATFNEAEKSSSSTKPSPEAHSSAKSSAKSSKAPASTAPSSTAFSSAMFPSAAPSSTPPSFSAPSATPPSFAAPSATPPSFAATSSALPSFSAPSSSASSPATPSPTAFSSAMFPSEPPPASHAKAPPSPPALDSPAAPADSGAQDGFSFASVIDLPEFPHGPQPPPKPGLTHADTPPPSSSGIQFSTVIR